MLIKITHGHLVTCLAMELSGLIIFAGVGQPQTKANHVIIIVVTTITISDCFVFLYYFYIFAVTE